MTAATIYRVIVPSVPAGLLGPNVSKGRHWAEIHRAKRVLQQEWCAEIRSQLVIDTPIGGAVRVTVRYLWPARRQIMDADNATALTKYILDSFTIAGVWGDDKQVADLRVEQEKLDRIGLAVYPHGATVVDVAEWEQVGEAGNE